MPKTEAFVCVNCYRHETPVLARSIEVMHLDEELVVLDKPCSLPVSSFVRSLLLELFKSVVYRGLTFRKYPLHRLI